jgi:ribosomal protein L16 Arg81 hydroxylase
MSDGPADPSRPETPSRSRTDFTRAIAPVLPETFFDSYFERRHLVVRRDDPHYFDSLLNLADIDAVLTGTMVPVEDMSMVNTGRPIEPARYTTATGHVDPVRASHEFAAGGTIILPALHRRLPALAAYCRSLETVFGCDLQTNIYFTPDNAQGFRTHYDMHDVIVLQVHGSKTWRIYQSALELPLHSQPFDPEGFVPGPVIDEFVLNAGDMCYVPRGLVHDAIATDQISLHITTGLLAHRWVDLLLEAVAEAAQRDLELRRSVPPGFASGSVALEGVVSAFRAMLDRAVAGIEPERTLKGFAADFRTRRAPVVPGHFLQHLAAGQVAPGVRVARRPDLIHTLQRLRTDEGGTPRDEILLDIYGTEIGFPGHVEPALRDALGRTEAFRVGDLAGGLDEQGQAVLVRRLVREGVLLVQAP